MAKSTTKRRSKSVSTRPLDGLIRVLRGQRVMLDSDLAELYAVETKVLNQAVRRNRGRFPEDFMFRLTAEEAAGLRSQIVTLKGGRGQHAKYAPSAFTEHGVAMLSSVLRSPRAVQMNILIVRAFVRMRELITSSRDLADRIGKLEYGQERTVSVIEVLAEDIDNLAREVKQIKTLPAAPRRRIGFQMRGGCN